MPKLKPGTLIPTPEEDAAITAAAMSDPDATPYTDTEWEAVKPTLKRGRPLACWCRPGLACHADVLLAIANGVES